MAIYYAASEVLFGPSKGNSDLHHSFADKTALAKIFILVYTWKKFLKKFLREG